MIEITIEYRNKLKKYTSLFSKNRRISRAKYELERTVNYYSY